MASSKRNTNKDSESDKDSDSEDHLFEAVENEDMDSIRTLLKYGVNVNARDSSGKTVLGRVAF